MLLPRSPTNPLLKYQEGLLISWWEEQGFCIDIPQEKVINALLMPTHLGLTELAAVTGVIIFPHQTNAHSQRATSKRKTERECRLLPICYLLAQLILEKLPWQICCSGQRMIDMQWVMVGGWMMVGHLFALKMRLQSRGWSTVTSQERDDDVNLHFWPILVSKAGSSNVLLSLFLN